MGKKDTVLIAMGGGEIAEARGVLDKIIEQLDKKPDAHIAVMTVATNNDREAADKYNNIF